MAFVGLWLFTTLMILIFLGYSFVGLVCYLVLTGLGEMSAYLPHKKGFSGYATRFVGSCRPSEGDIRGTYTCCRSGLWFCAWLELCFQVSASSVFCPDTTEPNPARYLIVTPNNINAAGVVIQYWTRKVHIAIWMGTCIHLNPATC